MPTVTIKLSEQGTDFARRFPELVKIQRHPSGIDFYKIDWDRSQDGIVAFDNGRQSVTVHHVIGLSTSQENGPLANEGFTRINVYSGVSAGDLIAHDEARLKIHAILKQIMDAGWQQVIDRSNPRLKGKARLEYMFATSNLNGLDATYIPTFDEWMRIQSLTPWSFYANGIYLDVEFTRERTLTDPTKPGSYLLTFDLRTEVEYHRDYAGPDHRVDWKPYVAPELAKAAASRAEAEAKLRAAGVEIDDKYRDPPLPAALTAE